MAKEEKKMTNHFKSSHLSWMYKWMLLLQHTTTECHLIETQKLVKTNILYCTGIWPEFGMKKCTTLKSNPFFLRSLNRDDLINKLVYLRYALRVLSGTCSNGICQYAILSQILLKPEIFSSHFMLDQLSLFPASCFYL